MAYLWLQAIDLLDLQMYDVYSSQMILCVCVCVCSGGGCVYCVYVWCVFCEAYGCSSYVCRITMTKLASPKHVLGVLEYHIPYPTL